MRTIKFRGLEANPYCEELRTFLYGTPLFITNEENYILPNFWDYEGLNKFKVLKKTISQFTGLHDKNGKEIYEGDVCKLVKAPNMDFIKDKNPFEVRYGKGAQFYGYVDGWLEDVYLYDLESYEYEVLGNIYENPELISKTSTHEH